MSASEAARARGNELYKTGAIADAIPCYEEANRLAPDQYAPLANLAAAYYEIGDYEASNRFADRALAIATKDSTQASQVSKDRLLLRRVRACLLSGQVEAARSAHEACPPSISNDLADITRYLRDQSRSNGPSSIEPLTLPVLKPTIFPSPEYELVGIDPPTSLFDSSLLSNDTKDLSLLFVNASDLRNVLATIVRVADPAIKKPADLRVRLVLAESRTHVVARQLVILSLLDRVASSPLALETLVYVYTAAILPPKQAGYLSEVISSTIASIKNARNLSAVLHVSKQDEAAILDLLDFWMSQASSYISTKDLRAAASQKSTSSGISSVLHLFPARMKKEVLLYNDSGFLLADQSGSSQEDGDLSTLLTRLSVSLEPQDGDIDKIDSTWKPNVTLIGPNPDSSASVDPFIIRLEHSPFDLGSQVADQEITERQGLFDLLRRWLAKIAKAFAAIKDQVQIDICQGDVTQLLLSCQQDQLDAGASDTPPPLGVFDRIHLSAYPDVSGGSLWIYTFAGPILRPRPESYITWKCLSKAAGFKSWKNYDREYLMIKQELGAKHKEDIASLFDIRVDKDVYSEDEASIKFESFGVVGYCRARRVGKARQGFAELVPRAVLTSWLHRVFLKMELPAPSSTEDSAGIISPLNQNFFFHLLKHLHRRGYPAHWLHDVMQNIWDGTLLTDARPPHTKPLLSKELLAKRAVSAEDITLAQQEFKTLAAIWSKTLPFAFVPHGSPAATDLQRWQVTFDGLKSAQLPQTYVLLIRQKEVVLAEEKKGWKMDRDILSLITTFDFDRSTKTAAFWSSQAVFQQLIQTGNMVEVWDTESWTCQSQPVQLSECRHEK